MYINEVELVSVLIGVNPPLSLPYSIKIVPARSQSAIYSFLFYYKYNYSN